MSKSRGVHSTHYKWSKRYLQSGKDPKALKDRPGVPKHIQFERIKEKALIFVFNIRAFLNENTAFYLRSMSLFVFFKSPASNL